MTDTHEKLTQLMEYITNNSKTMCDETYRQIADGLMDIKNTKPKKLYEIEYLVNRTISTGYIPKECDSNMEGVEVTTLRTYHKSIVKGLKKEVLEKTLKMRVNMEGVEVTSSLSFEMNALNSGYIPLGDDNELCSYIYAGRQFQFEIDGCCKDSNTEGIVLVENNEGGCDYTLHTLFSGVLTILSVKEFSPV